MKRSIVLFVLLSAFVVGVCMVNAACGASLSRTESDDVLDGIQKKNELAMNNCFVQNTAAPLDSLFTKLNKLEDGTLQAGYDQVYLARPVRGGARVLPRPAKKDHTPRREK